MARNGRVFSFYYSAGSRTLGKIDLFTEPPTSPLSRWKLGIELWGYTHDR